MLLFNGNDAVVLRRDDALVDVIGQIGTDPGAAWTGGGASALDGTMRRRADVMTDDTDGADVFDPAAEWDGFPIDSFTGLGSHEIAGGSANRPPTAVADAAQTDHSPVRIDVLANDSDPDGDPLSVVALDGATAGLAEVSDDGAAVLYTPPAGAWTREVFSYTVSDPTGATSSAEIEVIFSGEPDPGPEPDPDDRCDTVPSVEGTDGADLLFGTPGPDVIHAGAGNDIVFGLGGDDVICGGAGIDILFGNRGDDIIIDDSGRTWAVGGHGDDVIRTGDGRDALFGGLGDDSLDGGLGGDVVGGGRGQDLCGTDPADRVLGCP